MNELSIRIIGVVIFIMGIVIYSILLSKGARNSKSIVMIRFICGLVSFIGLLLSGIVFELASPVVQYLTIR